jgi:hypothetical protein
VRGAEAIGYMLAFSQMIDTRMLALAMEIRRRTPTNCCSPSSAQNNGDFLRLLRSNGATDCGDDEIEAAHPIARALSQDVMRQVAAIATMLFDGDRTLSSKGIRRIRFNP